MNLPFWIALLAPLAVFLAALVAYIGVHRTVQQRALADARDQWWKRAQWALEQVLSGEETRRATGLALMGVLAQSSLATEDDRLMLNEVGRSVALSVPELLSEEETAAEYVVEPGDGGTDG